QPAVLVRRAGAAARGGRSARGARGVRSRLARALGGAVRVPDGARRGRAGRCAGRGRLGGVGRGVPVRGRGQCDGDVVAGGGSSDGGTDGAVLHRAGGGAAGGRGAGGHAAGCAAQFRDGRSVLLGGVHAQWGPQAMNSRLQVGIALGVVVALGWLGGCSDNPNGVTTETPPPKGMLVSDPGPLASHVSSAGSLSSLEGDELVYVSVYPGTVRGAASVAIHNPTARFTLVAAASDGGIDPVPVPGLPGDSVIVVVTDSSGQSVRFGEEVRANRPPIVIRTEPPHKKTDVPVNAALVVVFSEPMDSATITSQSIQLVANGQPVDAQVAFGPDHLRAAIAVHGGLASNTSYTLVVTPGVRDLTGLSLPQRTEVDFTTGSTTGRENSLTITPSGATVPVGSVLQLT